ncbi:serine/threonine protein kinase, partial [Pyxidicoccus sp. 3LFB2]
AVQPPTAQATATPEPVPPQPVSNTTVVPVTTRPDRQENLPEQTRQALVEAESALKAGNAEEAIRLAKLSQRTAEGVRVMASYSILTRAHCMRKDLGAINGEWPKVATSDKPKVRQLCKEYGYAL